jgi:hypothetical protein
MANNEGEDKSEYVASYSVITYTKNGRIATIDCETKLIKAETYYQAKHFAHIMMPCNLNRNQSCKLEYLVRRTK